MALERQVLWHCDKGEKVRRVEQVMGESVSEIKFFYSQSDVSFGLRFIIKKY